jgi:RNA polymerase sigma factor (sigma-70 family)
MRHNGNVDPDRSFERIYRRHHREVYGSVLRDVRDPDEAEDVTQVAFLNAFRAMRRGDRPERPRAWLLTIARNVVRRRARLRAERPQEVELEAELLVTLEDTEGSASEDICAALRRLTDAQRHAILLREIQGRSYAEIASELDLSVPAVEALIFRARRALTEELELVERGPVVRRKGSGLFALPGLAKVGSFGFSFGRVSAACLVGCAVLATGPVRDGTASEDPAAVTRSAVRQAVEPAVVTTDSVQHAHPQKKERKHRSPGGHQQDGAASDEPSQSEDAAGSGSLLPVQLPPVEVPTVEVPAVELPPLPVPPVDLPPPPLPDVQLPPPLPSVTS